MNEPKMFTVIRHFDATGISGVGRIVDGIIFHTGQVVVCWRSDINESKLGYSSISIYPSWEAFRQIHIDSHPENQTEVLFGGSGWDRTS